MERAYVYLSFNQSIYLGARKGSLSIICRRNISSSYKTIFVLSEFEERSKHLKKREGTHELVKSQNMTLKEEYG